MNLLRLDLRFFHEFFKKLMPLAHDFQQNLYRRLWANVSKRICQDKISLGVIVKNKVLGEIELVDIERRIKIGEIQTFTALEVQKSQSLKEAIDKGWVEVIRGLYPTKTFVADVVNERMKLIKDKSMSNEEILNLAREMAKTMASEMSKEILKNNDTIKQIVVELANEMVDKINNKVIIKELETKKDLIIDDNKPEDIFVEIEENEMKMQTNIKDIGKVTEDKTDISESLEKMKRFRRKVGS